MSDHDDEHAMAGEEGENEEQLETEEEEEPDPDKPLTEEMVGDSLALLCKTGDGLAHAYVKLDVKDKALTDISLLAVFIHLRYIDVSKNNLRDISALSALTHLLVIKADHNKLTSAALEELPYLQVASFNNNRFKTTEGLNHPQLEHLCLNFNEITEVTGLEPSRLQRLHTIEMRRNKLASTEGLFLPNVKNLFLAGNLLKRIDGLERLEHLSTLHLRENQIDCLDGFGENMKNLQYVNLRSNCISDVKEVKKLQVLPLIRALVFDDNPIAQEDDYRLEMLIALRRIERLDKNEYTDDDRVEAQDIYEQRRKDELAQQECEMFQSGNEEVIPSDED